MVYLDFRTYKLSFVTDAAHEYATKVHAAPFVAGMRAGPARIPATNSAGALRQHLGQREVQI